MSLEPVASLSAEAPALSGPADVLAEEREYQLARESFLAPERASSGGLLLLGTLVLFSLSMMGDSGWKELVLLIAVLLFHEAGHWAGMRLFGFQDVKMFFIPFFGAAVSGRNVGAQGWKEALVLLLGPVPGIFAGCLVGAVSWVSQSTALAQAAFMLLAVNGFNLLPIVPLDGGRLFQVLVFSRHRYLELGFTLLTSLALAGLAVVSESWLLGVVAFLNLVVLPRQARLLRVAGELRKTAPSLVQEPARLEDESMRALYQASAGLVPAVAARQEEAYKRHAQVMRNLHQHIRQCPPSVLASLGLAFLWFVGVVALLVGLALCTRVPGFTS
jgi:Zn-dependent protease